MEWYRREGLVKFQAPCRIMVCGASGSGKTYITKQLLEHADGMFSEPTKKLIVCYDTWQPMFDDMRAKLDITFHQGLPDEDLFNEWSNIIQHKILVIDDCLAEGADSPALMKMFCVKKLHASVPVDSSLTNDALFSTSIYMQSKYWMTYP